jgi:hypothetical protein
VIALLIRLVCDGINPLGGILFPPVDLPGWDPIEGLLTGSWVVSGMLVVYGLKVADQAFDDGVSPIRAYGTLVAGLVLLVPVTARLFVQLVALGDAQQFAGSDEGVAQLVWWSLVTMYEGGFGLTIYAYWRVTQRAMRRTQVAETERVRNEQRVQTARLLALQSRVDPQLLFDALDRIGTLHDHDPPTADALLADLIALLRSMQPSARTDNSTVQREFALVRAWMSVNRTVGRDKARVHLAIAPDSAAVGIAPMLVLPLLRHVLAGPRAAECEWTLSAQVVRQRLLITLGSSGAVIPPVDVLAGADLTSLQDRLEQLFGLTARLVVSAKPPSLTLDLPHLLEDSHDHGADS